MNIGTKLGLLVAGLLAAQLATVGVGVGLVNAERAHLKAVVAEQQRDTELVLAVRQGFQRQNTAWNRMIVDAADPTLAQRHEATFTTSTESVQVLMDELDAVTTDKALRVQNARFRRTHDELTPQMRAGFASLKAGRYDPTADHQLQQDQTSALRLSDEQLDLVQQTANLAIAEQERDARTTVLAVSVVIGLFVLLLAGLAWYLIGRIVRPIVALTRRATQAAHRELPEATARIQAMDRRIEAPELAPFSSGTTDELADLAGALTVFQERAVDLAVQQRRTERDNAETLVNLGRRNQSLLARTLSYVSELERSERDAGALAQLFRLDHLVTRIRRNAESMLVLAGADQARKHAKPATMDRAIRAALAEIEDFSRVCVGHLTPVQVVGSVRADLSHLLAELLENATQFSPASTKVSIRGERTVEGYRVLIRDNGLGMDAEQLAHANQEITAPGARPENAGRLGHHIVGRLAERSGMRVHLEAAPDGGILAVVDLPAEVLLTEELPRREPRHEETPHAAGAAPLPSRKPPLPSRKPTPLPTRPTAGRAGGGVG